MGLNSNNVDDSTHGDSPVSNAHEEKILVSIRLRPLNEKELTNNDVADWECINDTTILFNNSLSERSTSPTAYSFDRVFGSDCSTRKVYEESAKNVALSVVSGINSSIFAYGQTSSGKTYTMSGITGHTIEDVYDYVDKNTSRKFVLKFSAMEIYNEAVRDLLSSDATPLRLLDDPEKGTVVEKLTEITLRDWRHLKELLCVCEAQRKIGETSLNEMSSRSHQILRLTVESTAREYKRFENSSTLSATVNFVDLAGSERASQTLSAGTRLKEGCHINRSLLTLGTVIRKLSKGRNVHVPYRDSKLTRILQNSLGGNARTAIICTMSPAHCHIEQSRNTLLFASCAKQVNTNAHVNVMMSEKTLIKQLQRELARLENQLKNLGSLSTSGDSLALKEKELLIEKMDKEIRELIQQRDHAQFRLQNFASLSPGEYHGSKPWDELSIVSEPQDKGSWHDEYSASEASETIDPFRLDFASSISPFSDISEGLNLNKQDEQFPEPSEEQFLSNDTSPRLFIEKYFGPDPTKGWEKTASVDLSSEDICKEVQCIEIDTIMREINLDRLSSPQHENQGTVDIHPDSETLKPTVEDTQETIICLENQGNVDIHHDNETLKPTVEDTQETIKCLENQGNVDIHHDNETLNPTVEDKQETIKCLENQGNIDIHHDNETLKPTVKDTQETIKCLVEFDPAGQSPCSSDSELSDSRINDISRSQSSGPVLTTLPISPTSEIAKEDDTPTTGFEKDSPKSLDESNRKFSKSEPSVNSTNLQRDHSYESFESDSTDSKQQIIMSLGLDDMVVKSEKQFKNDLVPEAELTSNKLEKDSLYVNVELDPQKSPSSWSIEFEKQRAEIIQLWDACNISLVHRSYFFLVFRGDTSDSIYMEVELRRLSYLKVSQGTKTERNGQSLSMKTINREREMLSKLMLKMFSTKERDSLFEKWGIGLKTKKRRIQLCRRLWTDTKDMEHIKESAALVAKLVGLVELSQVPKEIVGLSFSTPQVNIRSFSWIHSMPSLV